MALARCLDQFVEQVAAFAERTADAERAGPGQGQFTAPPGVVGRPGEVAEDDAQQVGRGGRRGGRELFGGLAQQRGGLGIPAAERAFDVVGAFGGGEAPVAQFRAARRWRAVRRTGEVFS